MNRLTKTIAMILAGILLVGCTKEVTSTSSSGSSTAPAGSTLTEADTADTKEKEADAAGTADTAEKDAGTENADNADTAPEPSDDAAGVFADIDIEGYGLITVALDPAAAPETVENFVTLAESGFYDGLTFHRIMEGFMMQGGDPLGNGSGGSDKKIRGEFTENGFDNPLSHTRGAISMARAKDMNSASSQFFIVHQDALFLDGQYAAFGYVTEGMDVVDRVCTDARPVDNNGTIPAAEQPVIRSITIR